MTRRTPRPPTPITAELLRRWPLPEPRGEQGKDDRGRVLVVGGSDEIPGAVVLAATGALRAGAGKLAVATSRNVAIAVAVAVPEGRVIGLPVGRNGELDVRSVGKLAEPLSCVDGALVGPGMTDPKGGVAIIRHVLASRPEFTLVVDAAPLAAFAGRRPASVRRSKVIITPHAGEMARLRDIDRDAVSARPADVARETATELGLTVVLKGSETHVVGPDGTAFVNREAGCVGLGTSGSGDTLAGIVTGLAARGADPIQAACWGVYLHGRAGDVLARRIGPLGFLARELLDEIPRALRELGPRRARR